MDLWGGARGEGMGMQGEEEGDDGGRWLLSKKGRYGRLGSG